MSTSLATVADRVLDLVGDVRDHLHGASEVVAAPLLLDDALVDLAGRPVGVLRGQRAGEALVVTEVEVGLGAVVGHVDLAVLIRAHRPGIDVDIRIELLQRDPVAVTFEEAPDRGGGQALAQRGHHAAGDENVFGRPSVHMSPDPPSGSSRTLRACLLSGRRRRQQTAHLFEIPRRVHADRVVRGFDGLDADAVFERPQLFERFRALERRRARDWPARAACYGGRRRGRYVGRAAAIRPWGRACAESARARNTARTRRDRRTTLTTFGSSSSARCVIRL